MEQNPDGDPDFDPEHNARVIKETVRKNNLLRARKLRDNNEGIRERASAAATFIKSADQGGRTLDIKKYFGKEKLDYLKGKYLKERIDEQLRVVKDGRVVHSPEEM